jgi:hypothetical protein
MVAERVRVLGVLCSLESKIKLSAEQRWALDDLSIEGKEKWIEDYCWTNPGSERSVRRLVVQLPNFCCVY